MKWNMSCGVRVEGGGGGGGGGKRPRKPTHISFVLEGVVAGGSAAVEVGGALPGKGTVGRSAILGGTVALESLLDDGRILTMVVGVHLHI